MVNEVSLSYPKRGDLRFKVRERHACHARGDPRFYCFVRKLTLTFFRLVRLSERYRGPQMLQGEDVETYETAVVGSLFVLSA